MINRIRQFFGRATDQRNQAADAYQRTVQRAFSNPSLGYGGANDIISNTEINGARLIPDDILEALYINSWAAEKVIDLVVDDVFSPGIVWGGEDEAKVEVMQQQIDALKVMRKLPSAIKAARLFGSCLVILAPKSGDFEEPLVPEQVRPDDISHLLVAPRCELDVWQVHGDPALPMYGEPYTYRWSLSPDGKMPIDNEMAQRSQITVSASRCLRFDGIPPMTDQGWKYVGGTDRRWGVSLLSRVYEDIVADLIMNGGSVELVKRASVLCIKVNDLDQVLSRGEIGDLISPERYASNISASINNAKIAFIDANNEIVSVDMRATGVKELVDNQTNRLAMIAGVPITRFTGASATGLSATGEGDAKDWRLSVESYRQDAIDPQWDMLMNILARNAGLGEVPEWEWGELGEMDPNEVVENAKKLSEATTALVREGVINEEEAREVLNSNELFNLAEDFEPPIMEVPKQPLMKSEKNQEKDLT